MKMIFKDILDKGGKETKDAKDEKKDTAVQNEKTEIKPVKKIGFDTTPKTDILDEEAMYKESVYPGYGGYGSYGGYGKVYSYVETADSIAWDLKYGYQKERKIEAAKKLAKMKTDEALKELVNALTLKNNDDCEVRIALVDAICSFGKKECAKNLLEAADIGTMDAAKIIEAIKEAKKERVVLVLGAMKIDADLGNKVKDTIKKDGEMIAALWKAEDIAHLFLSEFAAQGIDIEKNFPTSEDSIKKAFASDSKEIRKCAIDSIKKSKNVKFIPELLDSLMIDDNWQETEKMICSILGQEKAIGKILIVTDNKPYAKSLKKTIESTAEMKVDTCEYDELESLLEDTKNKSKYSKIIIEINPVIRGKDALEKIIGSELKRYEVILTSLEEDDKEMIDGLSRAKFLKMPVKLPELIKLIVDENSNKSESKE